MHWQQYITLSTGCLSGFVFMVVSILGKTPHIRTTATWQFAYVTFMQWVLYSGGWYSQ